MFGEAQDFDTLPFFYKKTLSGKPDMNRFGPSRIMKIEINIKDSSSRSP